MPVGAAVDLEPLDSQLPSWTITCHSPGWTSTPILLGTSWSSILNHPGPPRAGRRCFIYPAREDRVPRSDVLLKKSPFQRSNSTPAARVLLFGTSPSTMSFQRSNSTMSLGNAQTSAKPTPRFARPKRRLAPLRPSPVRQWPRNGTSASPAAWTRLPSARPGAAVTGRRHHRDVNRCQ